MWKALAIFVPVLVLLHMDGLWDGTIIDWFDGHDGLAAWVQAGGVFLAVVWSGQLARDLAASQEETRRKDLVASVRAVLGKVATEVNDVDSALLLKWQGTPGVSPLYRLSTVQNALTPKRIHELPDPILVELALDTASNLAQLVAWLMRNEESFSIESLRPPAVPPHITGLIETVKKDCGDFYVVAQKASWRSHQRRSNFNW